MAEPISIQQLKDASEDAITLADFIYKPANVMIPRRLAADINSLQYYLDYMSSYAQHSYETYDEMVANAVNLPNDVSAFVTNDLDATKNGIYTYNGTSFVKGDYQPENAAKDFVEDKLGGLEVIEGKVRAQDVSTTDGSTQEIKNSEFRDELDALPFEGGVLADTFVVDESLNQRQINRGLSSISEMLEIPAPTTGTRVYVKSYYQGLNRGGGTFIYDSSKSSVNLKGIVENGWVRLNDSSGIYYLDWILPDVVDDVSVYTSSALSAISQSDNYHTLKSTGTYTFKASLGVLTDGCSLIGGEFLALNDIPSAALECNGEVLISEVTLDLQMHQCASAGVVFFNSGGGEVRSSKIRNAKNLSSTYIWANLYGIFSRGTGDYDLLVDDCHIHDIYTTGDNIETNFGFCGGVFLYAEADMEGTQKLVVKNSTLEKFKTIFRPDSTEASRLADNDADALRVYCESTAPDIVDRLSLVSENNTFNYCSKRFYKASNATLYVDGDKSYKYYTDICMNGVGQCSKAVVRNSNYTLNMQATGFFIYGSSYTDNIISNITLNNYLPTDLNSVYPVVSLASRGTVASCNTESDLLIEDVRVYNLSGVYRGVANGNSPNLTISRVSGHTLGIFVHWGIFAGTKLTVHDVDIEFRTKAAYVTNAVGRMTANSSVYFTTYADDSPYWHDGVNRGNIPISYWNNVVLRDVGFHRGKASLGGNDFLPFAANRTRIVLNNTHYLANDRVTATGYASCYFDDCVTAHIINCTFDSTLAVREIDSEPYMATAQIYGTSCHTLLLAGNSPHIRAKYNIETTKFASVTDYNEFK